MQQRIFAALGLVAALTFAALPGSALADTKIAVVRFDDAVRASPQYKAADQKMTSEFSKRKTDLEAQQKSFEDDVKKYQRDGATLGPDQRAKTEKDLSVRQLDLQQAARKFQEDQQARTRDLTNEVVSKVRDAVVALAKEKGYDLVVPEPVYSTPALDVTDEVLKRLGGAAAGK
ncbi:MAG: OmpH family outer membrane protein [Nevskia sp.]